MRKFAHTLAEVLVALAIIGVLGGVTIPMVNKFKPDVNKVKFLKNYDAIVKVNNHLMYNTSLYNETDGTFSYDRYPFVNTHQVGENINAGNSKYCQLLSEALSENISTACPEAYSKTTNPQETPHFTAKDGTDYWVYTDSTPTNITDSEIHGIYTTKIFIDIDSKNTANCTYDINKCPNPDRFSIYLAADGSIAPSDKKGIEYLNTRSSYKKNSNNNEANMNRKVDFDFEYILKALNPTKNDEDNEKEPCPEGQFRFGDGPCIDRPNFGTTNPENESLSNPCFKLRFCRNCFSEIAPSDVRASTDVLCPICGRPNLDPCEGLVVGQESGGPCYGCQWEERNPQCEREIERYIAGSSMYNNPSMELGILCHAPDGDHTCGKTQPQLYFGRFWYLDWNWRYKY